MKQCVISNVLIRLISRNVIPFFFRRLRTIVLSIKRRVCIKHGENKYQQKFTFKYYVLTPFTLFLVNIPLLTFIKYLQYAGNTVVCF